MYQLLKYFMVCYSSFFLISNLIDYKHAHKHMLTHTQGRAYASKQKADIHYTPNVWENPLDFIIDISELI